MLIQGQQSYNLPPLSRGSLSTTERTVPVVILLAEELLQQTLSTLLSTYWYLWGVEYRAKVICLFLLDFLSRGKTSNRTISTPPQSQYYFRFFSGHDKLRKMHVIKLSWNVLLQCGWYFAKLNGAQPQPYFNHRTAHTAYQNAVLGKWVSKPAWQSHHFGSVKTLELDCCEQHAVTALINVFFSLLPLFPIVGVFIYICCRNVQ